MKLSSAAVLLAALAVPAAIELHAGCAHPSRPPAEPVVEPDERPPLPPAAGTPIGYLVDASAELELSDAQLGQLQSLNDELAGQLATDDAGMRPEPVMPPPGDRNKGRGLGFRAGGGTDGGGLRAGGFPGPAADTAHGSEGETRSYIIPADVVTRVYRARARHIREAIAKAFALFEPAQRTTAQRVLVDHGVNPDTGEVRGGDPGTTKLEDPKLGQPLPTER